MLTTTQKFLSFRKFRHLLCKYYSKFVKGHNKRPHRLLMRQFLVLLYDCILDMKHVWSIGRLLQNANILKSVAVKNTD